MRRTCLSLLCAAALSISFTAFAQPAAEHHLGRDAAVRTGNQYGEGGLAPGEGVSTPGAQVHGERE